MDHGSHGSQARQAFDDERELAVSGTMLWSNRGSPSGSWHSSQPLILLSSHLTPPATIPDVKLDSIR